MAQALCREKLHKNERCQIAGWIGESVNFNLLYKATRDGMSGPIFHSKCDKKGPTVTVCWNTVGCVYGGYTSVDWHSTSYAYVHDAKAFLFLLQSMGKNQPTKFAIKAPVNAIYCHGTYGPTFGSGHDMLVFNGVINKDGNGVFNTSGGWTIGTAYQNCDLNMAVISNINYNYTEVEVYQIVEKVLLSKPWRDDTQDKTMVLKKSLEDYCPVDGAGVKQVRILLVGSVGSGKSSYFNTINSTFRGHVTSQASTGSAEHSLTTMYRHYQVRSGSTFLKFRLCDTRGMEDKQGVDPGDIAAMMDGHIPDRYSINPFAPMTPEATGYIKSPSLNDKIHCVAFVVDGSSVDFMNDSMLSKFKVVQTLANQRSLPQVVLLTKVDKIGLEVEQDLGSLLYSSQVSDVIDKVAELIGLPRGHVLPVKNYEKETDLNDIIGRLALLSVQKMLRFADDYLYDVSGSCSLSTEEIIRANTDATFVNRLINDVTLFRRKHCGDIQIPLVAENVESSIPVQQRKSEYHSMFFRLLVFVVLASIVYVVLSGQLNTVI